MPFSSDEQRRAAFARMGGGGRSNYGGGGNRPPRPPRPPSGGGSSGGGSTSDGSAYTGNGGNGYAGNYISGLPDYSDWYESLPNTTQNPPLAPGGTWLTTEDTFDWSNWMPGEGGYIWLIDPNMIGGVRELTDAEKLLLGIPLAAAVGWAAPTIFAGTDFTLAAGGEIAIEATGSIFLSVAGTQGGALGYSAVAITGIPMTVNDSMYTSVDGLNVVGSYPDMVSAISAWLNDSTNDGWVPPSSYGSN